MQFRQVSDFIKDLYHFFNNKFAFIAEYTK